MTRVPKIWATSVTTLLILCLMVLPAFAACTTPAGNAGDVVFSSLSGQMAYCNGTSWIGMGVNQPVGFGTLTPTDFCTATSGTQISCTTATINLSSQASGTVQAAQFPALTGDVTTTAGSLATTISANKVLMADIAQIAGLSVLGNTGSSTGNVGPITGTANQVLVVNSAGTGLVFGPLNLSSVAAITGTLGTANGGTGLGTYNKGDILYASASNTLSALPIGTSGYILTASAGGIPVWSPAPASGVTSFSAGTTGLTPASASTGAIVLSGVLVVANGGTGLATLTSNVIYKGNGTGNLAVSGLTDNGTIVSSSESIDATGNGYLTEIANGTVATVLNSLAKLDASGKATAALVSDTDGVIGIVVGGAGTSGTAQIAINGQAICNFDGTAVVGHFVTISSTTAGDCHDTGAATRSTTAQTIGRVLTGGTTATVALGLNGAGGGAASGSTGYVQFNNSGAFLGTSNLFWDNTNNRLGIGSPAPTVGLDLSQKTDAIALPVGTTGTRPTCSVGVNGALRYNSTIPAVEACVNGAWVSVGAGGGQLLGSYSSGTPVSNYSVVFTGAAGSAPSFSGSTLTLASNTAYIVVETWGGGGGGAGGGIGGVAGNGTASGSTCFGTNSTACTSPTVSATGGGGGATGGGNGGTGGAGSGGDVNLTGGGGGAGISTNVSSVVAGGAGGNAPRGGGAGLMNYTGNEPSGAAYGGGGAGGGIANVNSTPGDGGGGGGYASKFINNPAGNYYYTIGGGGSGGNGGTNGYNGGPGGAGGITITAYSSGSTQAFNMGTQATGTLGVANGGTGTTTPFTQGSVVFAGASGVYSQDNANLFYDATNHRLGIGTSSPQNLLDVNGAASIGYNVAAPTNGLIVSGNVGIGTTGPTAALDITRPASTAVAMHFIQTGQAEATLGHLSNDANFYITNTYGIGAGGLGTAAKSITLANTGNVGIGTANPSGILHSYAASNGRPYFESGSGINHVQLHSITAAATTEANLYLRMVLPFLALSRQSQMVAFGFRR